MRRPHSGFDPLKSLKNHLIERLDFDRPIEFRFKKSTLSFTHWVILPWFMVSIVREITVVIPACAGMTVRWVPVTYFPADG